MCSLPSTLLVEVRLAFSSCSRTYAASRRSQFSTLSPLLRKTSPASKSPKGLPIQVVHHKAQQERAKDKQAVTSDSAKDDKDLIPHPDGNTSIATDRKFHVPLKVIPKAQITANLTLSPKERLQIEQLTRRTPAPPPPPVYKKKIRIYSAGYPRIYGVLFVKFTFIFALSIVTFVVVPAQWMADVPVWVIAGFWLAWLVPAVYVYWNLRGFVSEIFLRLPAKAQSTPKAAMEYAKSLPQDSVLELTYMRWTMLPATIPLKLGQLQPVTSKLQLANFGVVGPLDNAGTFFRPTPTKFYVRARSAGGMAAKDTIPGIWHRVYARLTQSEGGTATKWR